MSLLEMPQWCLCLQRASLRWKQKWEPTAPCLPAQRQDSSLLLVHATQSWQREMKHEESTTDMMACNLPINLIIQIIKEEFDILENALILD